MQRFCARTGRFAGMLRLAIVCAVLPAGCPVTGTEAGDLTGGAGNAGDAGNSGTSGLGSAAGFGATGGPPEGLPGVWQATFVDPTFGPAQVELILMSNGRFQQQTFYQAGSLITIFGTYRVFPTEPLLRLDIERGEPSQSCGPLGCSPILYPAGESHAYSLTANGGLVLQNVYCAPGQGGACVLSYVRTG